MKENRKGNLGNKDQMQPKGKERTEVDDGDDTVWR